MTRNVSLLFVAVLVLAVAGCYLPSPKPGKAVTLQQKVGLGSAETASASITIGVGKLKIEGGADSLLDARFEYNIPDWKPVLSYKVEDCEGQLTVEQPSRVVGATWPGNVRYDWNLRLNRTIPMNLEINLGVGKSDVDLNGVNVHHLDLVAGVGEGSVDLSGPRTSDLDATIKAGVGKLTLILPTDVGVRVTAQAGLGHVDASGLKADGDAWVNDVWGKTKTSLRIEVEGGIGAVELRLAGPTAGGI
ncbi:MAG TPA: toast rack family protein [bacterium]|nr:toast rack family protein [bacterium]